MDFLPLLVLAGVVAFIIYKTVTKRDKSGPGGDKPGNDDSINRPK